MPTKTLSSRPKEASGGELGFGILTERVKRLRAMNKDPGRIGLTQYTWHSYSINKMRDAK